jgi:hypothetical protein
MALSKDLPRMWPACVGPAGEMEIHSQGLDGGKAAIRVSRWWPRRALSPASPKGTRSHPPGPDAQERREREGGGVWQFRRHRDPFYLLGKY